MREIRLEIERLKEQWQIARREGKEEKARELGNHIEELMVKLKHLAGELNADEREAEEKRGIESMSRKPGIRKPESLRNMPMVYVKS